MTGGLGTACQGLVKSLVGQGVDVFFVMPGRTSGGERIGPRIVERTALDDRLLTPANRVLPRGDFSLIRVPPALNPYAGARAPVESKTGLFQRPSLEQDLYGGDLLEAVKALARETRKIAEGLRFDIVHAHDWMTFPAAIAARKVSGKPFVAHLHSTEYDRCLDAIWPPVCRIEAEGLAAADAIITVSARSKWQVVEKYQIEPEKIQVVHNGLNRDHLGQPEEAVPLELSHDPARKIVLFLGRITPQKGPSFFLEAAARILETEPDTLFLFAGSGDLVAALVERTAELGISESVLFLGFLDGLQVQGAFQAASVYVMPSVSDPFGISCLEAMYLQTPVVVSNQTGIAEVAENVLKVNYWEVEEIAAKVVRLLRDPQYASELASRGAAEARRITWEHPAARCRGLYKEVLARSGLRPLQE